MEKSEVVNHCFLFSDLLIITINEKQHQKSNNSPQFTKKKSIKKPINWEWKFNTNEKREFKIQQMIWLDKTYKIKIDEKGFYLYKKKKKVDKQFKTENSVQLMNWQRSLQRVLDSFSNEPKKGSTSRKKKVNNALDSWLGSDTDKKSRRKSLKIKDNVLKRKKLKNNTLKRSLSKKFAKSSPRIKRTFSNKALTNKLLKRSSQKEIREDYPKLQTKTVKTIPFSSKVTKEPNQTSPWSDQDWMILLHRAPRVVLSNDQLLEGTYLFVLLSGECVIEYQNQNQNSNSNSGNEKHFILQNIKSKYSVFGVEQFLGFSSPNTIIKSCGKSTVVKLEKSHLIACWKKNNYI